MFSEKHLQEIDSAYFNVLVQDAYDVTIQSRNTGHYWYLHCCEFPTEENCIIFHKHQFQHPYHQHGRARTLKQAVKSIVQHDKFQLNVRKRV